MKNNKKHILINFLVVFFSLIANLSMALAADFTSPNFRVRDPVISIFGGRSTSANFEQINAGGQIATGQSTSPGFILQSGFLYFQPAGVSSVTAPISTNFTARNVSFNAQTSTATINPVEVQSQAGGWSATMTSTHITTISQVQTIFGANSVTAGGTYDGTYGVIDPIKRYEVRIAAGGAVGTATYQWRVAGGTWTTPTTTAATVTLERGVQVNFPPDTYLTGDEWQFSVDVFPYTGLTVTPGDITVISGGGIGMSRGASETLTGAGAVSNPKTLMRAHLDHGVGVYQQPQNLGLNIRANSLSGNFQGTVTITIL